MHEQQTPPLYTVHCTLSYCAECTVCTVHCALYSVHCAEFTVCTVHCAGRASTCPRIHLSATFERRSCPGSTEKVRRHLLFCSCSLFRLFTLSLPLKIPKMVYNRCARCIFASIDTLANSLGSLSLFHLFTLSLLLKMGKLLSCSSLSEMSFYIVLSKMGCPNSPCDVDSPVMHISKVL